MPRARLALPLLLALAVLALPGCAGGPPLAEVAEPAERPEPSFTPEVARVTSASPAEEVAAAGALAEGEFEDAAEAYDALSRYEVNPARRAEYLFFAGEAWLAAGDAYLAYERYTSLLRGYPTSPRYGLAVERVFLVGQRYAEGRASKPTWLLGLRFADRGFGVEVLEEFQRARERHELADDALFLIGEAQLAEGEPEEAVAAWQKVVDEYPRSEWADAAEWRIGLAFVGMSDGPEYDKDPLVQGLTRLRRYVERRPTGDHVTEARQAIDRVEGGLAAQQLEVARFYLGRDRRYSAQVYLEAIVREYPRTPAADEATRLLRSLPRASPPPAKAEPEDAGPGLRTPPPPSEPLALPSD